MWTDTTRRQYARAELLLPSDLTDAEWAILEPLLPPRSKLGRPPVWDYRQIVEAILYRGLSSNGTENLHKGLQASSIPVAPGSRSGLNSPRATMSGMVKA